MFSKKIISGIVSAVVALFFISSSIANSSDAQFKKDGNNGTVSCSTYCGKVKADGTPEWGDKTGACVEAKNESTGQTVSCDTVPGLIQDGKQLTCFCTPDDAQFKKDGNNGTVSCSTYCGKVKADGTPEWGDKAGACVEAKNESTGQTVSCDTVPGLIQDGKQLTCFCTPDMSNSIGLAGLADSKDSTDHAEITNPLLPGLDRLGYGYNVLEKGYDPSVTDLHDLIERGEFDSYPIRDKKYQKPISVKVMEIGKTKAELSTHKSIVETQKSFFSSLGIEGSYGPYSGSLNASFSQETQEATETQIALINHTVSGYEAGFQSFNLKEEFQKNLQGGMAPVKVFQKYGTHMIQGVLLGGKVVGIYSSRKNEKKTFQDIAVQAQAKYEKVASVSVESKTDISKKNSLTSEDVKEDILIFGGLEELKSTLIHERTPQAFADWSKSVGEKPIYACMTKAVPLWEIPLIKGKARGKELERAFQELAAQKAIKKLQLFKTSSENIKNTTLTVPKGYKILSGGAMTGWKGSGVLLTSSYPSSTTTWTATAKPHMQNDPSGSININVIALYDPSDLFNVRIFTGPVRGGHLEPNEGIPVEQGYRLVGGGAKVNWKGEGALLIYSGLTENPKCYNKVFQGTTDQECERWFSAGKHHMKIGEGSEIRGYSIGIKPEFSGVNLVTRFFNDIGERGHSPEKTLTADSGYTLIGGGGRVTWDGRAGILMTASYPQNEKSWYVAGKDHVQSDLGVAKAYVIGLKVE